MLHQGESPNCTGDRRCWATVHGIGTTGCQVMLSLPAAMDWVSFGDPAISTVVNVDWTAIGR